ncbi:DNA-directed RNA polymerase subunit omega [Lutimonas sp.]|uniref:DNA-directed RNA polymerase subunit omega n=1 Tax=Lutimonas sp. TaxID=1872403 RepID=UPI003D9B3BFC
MKDYKNTEAPESTITFDKIKIEAPTQNIYKAIAIMSKRASQVNEDLKSELIDKLEEFATFNDSLEEVFENKEQIEVSRFYERLPKPTAIAVQEWLDEEIFYRTPEINNDNLD